MSCSGGETNRTCSAAVLHVVFGSAALGTRSRKEAGVTHIPYVSALANGWRLLAHGHLLQVLRDLGSAKTCGSAVVKLLR